MAEPYRVLGATELLFKASSKAADYSVPEKERKEDGVQLAEDGEEIGHSADPTNPWHGSMCFLHRHNCFRGLTLNSLQTPPYLQHLVPRYHAAPLPNKRPHTMLRA